MNTATIRLAVLVDADNATAGRATALFEEIATYGTATVRRAYGDWTTGRLAKWKDELHRLAIQPVQQFAYTSGKNATDSALIIDAMDLLHAGDVDGFVIVSSDSDFTRLATRLRESGKLVLGIGERKTPEAFVAACDRFVYLDLLDSGPAGQDGAVASGGPDLRRILTAAITSTAKDDGWSNLAEVGAFLTKSNAAFDPRDHGFAKLGELVRGTAYVEVEQFATPAGGSQLRVRLDSGRA